MRELHIGRPMHVLVLRFLFVQIRGDKILETFSRRENNSINLPNQEVPGRLGRNCSACVFNENKVQPIASKSLLTSFWHVDVPNQNC